MINLRPQDRQRIEQLATEYLHAGSDVWAYGSRVKGSNHDTSDLDLCVDGPKSAWLKVTEFRQALQDSNIPIIVQVLDWNRAPDYFQDNIVKCRELLIKL